MTNEIHPVLYTDDLSQFDWSENAKALALVKNIAWNYEEEWRFIKASSRPKMRLLGQVLSDIYNRIHTNVEFGPKDHEEWSRINSSIQKNLEKTFADERTLSLRPNRIILGAKFSKNLTNVSTEETCKSIVSSAKKFDIPIWLSRANKNSFQLVEVELAAENLTHLDFDPDLRDSLPLNVNAQKWL